MSVARSSSSFNSSAASSQINASVDEPEVAKIKSYVKDLLKSRIFLGRYLERRLADQQVGYRDVVLLSPAEVDLKADLLEALHRLRSACPKLHWIGISSAEPLGSPSGVCLWTEIDNQPFGPFWFQIKSIKYRDNEIIILLKCIRHITEAYMEIEPILTSSAKIIKSTTDAQPDSTAIVFSDTYSEIVTTLKGALSIRNVKEFVTFIIAFIIAVFTGTTTFINFVGNFTLALIREMSFFVRNSTPMFLGVLDFFSKIVGGFYILVAMIFRPSNPAPSMNSRAITSYSRRSRRNSGLYDDKCFD